MKKTIGMVSGLVLSFLSATAQTPENSPATDSNKTWDPRKNPTVDSIVSPYEAKLVTTRTAVTTTDIYPALGRYESATNADAPQVLIRQDEQSKGVVWVEGLPQGTVKALLLRSPATYKIPAQKNADGKDIPEGTIMYDKDTKTLSICIGRPYNYADPATVFAAEPAPATTTKKQKTKTPAMKIWVYTGTRVEEATASLQ